MNLLERLGWAGVLFLVLLISGSLLAILGSFWGVFRYYSLYAQIFGLMVAFAGADGLIRKLQSVENPGTS